MAWNTIHYACGHTGQVQLYGKLSDRDRKVAWLEREGLCHECLEEQQLAAGAASREARAALAPKIEALVPFSLPTLTGGSDKQIKWARDIRTDFLAAILGKKPDWQAIYTSDNPKIQTEIKKILESSAKWWIDNRSDRILGVRTPDNPIDTMREVIAAAPAVPAPVIAPAPQPTIILVKPDKPACYPTGRYNGKIYGSTKYGYSIYIDSVCKKITAAEKAEIEKYQQDMIDYRAAVEDIKAGNLDTDRVKRFRKPEPEVHDKPLVVAPPIDKAAISDIRRAVCRRAWVYIRQGKSKSEAFRSAWADCR